MAQDRFINIIADTNPVGKSDATDFKHDKKLGSAAANDLTVSFDSTKFTSLAVFKSALLAASLELLRLVHLFERWAGRRFAGREERS